MVTLFGTDGVRGVVNSTLMPELAFQLGRAAGAYFCREEGTHRVLIGMDTRISGTMVAAALSAGLGRRDSHTGYRIPDTDRKL